MLGLPFEHLNLRRNPFGELPLAERAAVALREERVALADGEIGQVVAERGRGKSTLLWSLAASEPGAVYARVGVDPRTTTAPPNGALYLLDEADRLSGQQLGRLLGRCRRALLATHEDLSSRAGRPLRTFRLPALTLARLRTIVTRRIEHVRRGPGPVPLPSDRTLADLLRRRGDDLRAVQDELYDLFQRLKGVADGEL
jgi:hypothetical protein